MSSKDVYDKMTEEEKEALEKLQKEILDMAKKVVEDYAENPSEEGETDVQIDFDSPYLDEVFEGESWKKVVKPQYIENLKKSLKKDKKKKKNDKKT
tara:strand:- start:234 stop:521 length:288 start_codon:yes stop_codon:yes gene_type:complete